MENSAFTFNGLFVRRRHPATNDLPGFYPDVAEGTEEKSICAPEGQEGGRALGRDDG